MPVGGALKLKGGEGLRGKKKHKKKEKRRRREEHERGAGLGPPRVKHEEEDRAPVEVRPIAGTGHVTSSGTAVTGHGTCFSSELAVGDTLIITHPTTLVEESRQVRMLLSDLSIGIDAPFSSDLVSTTSFRYVKIPREEEESEATRAAKRRKSAKADEGNAVGTYASGEAGDRVTLRVKKAGAYGGYQIIHQTSDRELTRTELLELRAKSKGDRHCM